MRALALLLLLLPPSDAPPPPRLEDWLAELALPPAVATALSDAGYTELGALLDAERREEVTDAALKGLGVLPWHRRKLLAALRAHEEAAAGGGEQEAPAAPRPRVPTPPEASEAPAAPAQAQAVAEQAEPPARSTPEPADLDTASPRYAVRLAAPAGGAGTFDAEGSLGLLLEDLPWHAAPLVSGVVVGSAAHGAGVLPGSALLRVNGRPARDDAAEAAEDGDRAQSLLSAAAAEGGAMELLFLRPGPVRSDPAATDHAPAALPAKSPRMGKGKGKGGRKAKRKKGKDRTAQLHAAIAGFSDLGKASKLLHKATGPDATSADFLDLDRPLELQSSGQPPRGAAQPKSFSAPVLSALLQQYNSLPLRRRPPAALDLAEQLVAAGAPPNDRGGRAGQSVPPLDFAALVKAPRLVRALLRAGADVDPVSVGSWKPSKKEGGTSGLGTALHHVLTARESTVLLARELQTAQLHTNALLAQAVKLSSPMAALFEEAAAKAREGGSGDGPRHLTLAGSALRLAVSGWMQPLVLGLLAHSRDPAALVGAQDGWGRTALHLACRADNRQALEAMDTSTALPTADVFGRTALHIAAMQGHTGMVDALRNHTIAALGDEAWQDVAEAKDERGRSYRDLLPAFRRRPKEPGQERSRSGGWTGRSSAQAFAASHGGGGCDVDVVDGMMDGATFVEGPLPLDCSCIHPCGHL